jgi:enoyl-CoA hydratase
MGNLLERDNAWNKTDTGAAEDRLREGGANKGLILIRKEAGIALLTINRPNSLNALNEEVLKELDTAIDEVISDPSIRAAVITGAKRRAFCAGVDTEIVTSFAANKIMEFVEFGNGILRKIEHSDKPFVAAINGFAVGGGNQVALACHGRVASNNACFGQPELRVGIIPFLGGTQRLPRLIGAGAAKTLIITGDIIPARLAEGIGLVDRVVRSGKLLKEAVDMAHSLCDSGLQDIKRLKFASRVEPEFSRAYDTHYEAGRAPLALREILSLVDKATEMDLDSGLRYESEAARRCFSSKDFREGITASMERREPNFVGE